MADRIAFNLSSAEDIRTVDNGDNSYSPLVVMKSDKSSVAVAPNPASIMTATITRTNGTTTYTPNTVVNAAVGAAVAFANPIAPGSSGLIVDAMLIDDANQTLKGIFELWLFQQVPAPQNDNVAFAPSDAELLHLLGIIQFSTAFVANAGAAAAGNAAYMAERTYLPIELRPIDPAFIYGVLVVRNAYVPVASEKFFIILRVMQNA